MASKVLAVAGFFVIVAGLRYGREFFVPLALSVLFSLLLSPLVRLGLKARLPRAVAVVGVVVAVFSLLTLLGYLLVGQAAAVGRRLPEYRANVTAKVDALRGPFSRVLRTVQEAARSARPAPAPPPGEARDPLKVEVVEGPPDVLKLAGAVLGPVVTLAGSFAVVFLLTIFFLLYQDEIRDRVIRLAGDAEVHQTTQTITEAAQGVSRFLFLQACVNLSYGATLTLALFALGVPNALLWGVLAALLRFIPYVGPVVGGILPCLAALAAFPGWSRPLFTAGVIVVLELVSNNFVEPLVYGKRTGLSPLAVVLAAVFWAWMWGGLGLLLAVPLTVCLVTLGRHAPSLRFLAVLFGDEPTLELKVRVYQRLLNGDQEAAAALLEKELVAGRSLAAVFDASLIGVLRLAQADLRRGKLEKERAELVFDGVRDVVDDLVDTARGGRVEEAPPRPGVVLCVPAGDRADELSAYMLAQLLEARGCRARALSAEQSAGEALESAASEGAELLVLCASSDSNLLRARYLYKRLRRRFGEIPIIEGLWGVADPKAVEARVAPDQKATLVTSLTEAEEVASRLAREASLRRTLREGAA